MPSAAAIRRGKWLLAAGAVVGLGLLGALAYTSSPAAIAAALTGGGLPLLVASIYRLVPLAFNTLSWRALLPQKGRPRFRTLLRLRWIGESLNALLPLPVVQVGGDLARARLLTVGGMSGAQATAAMVADLTVSAATQVLFTLLGVAALALAAPEHQGVRTGSIVAAAVFTTASAIALVAVARVGVRRMVAALPQRGRSGPFVARLAAGAAEVDRALSTLLARKSNLVRACAWHTAAWLGNAGETWLILVLLGHPVSFAGALAIESLSACARGAAFVVPSGLGVQEGAIVLVAAMFGIGAPEALALAIVKRGRELVVGLPAMLAWWMSEHRAIGSFLGRRTGEMKDGERTTTLPGPGIVSARAEPPLRVGVLVDLHWSPTAGGHVKTWERLASAAASLGEEVDLTVHFLGAMEATHVVAPNVRYRIHRPVLSTASLPFLSHVPDHTDLAPFHRQLAAQLRAYDVIHTTDGTFASARTAARVSKRYGIPLVNSVHTTTPYYTRVFTAATVERLAGRGGLARVLLARLDLAGRAEARMQRRLDAHQRACAFVLASREDDRARLGELLGPDRVGLLRRGIDHLLFDPRRRDRAWLQTALGVPQDRQVVISVGRLDRIKNVLLLANAVRLLAERGRPVHLLCPGKGADRDAVVALLGDRVTCPGVLDPDTLARAYASADLCAQPAVVEELSNAVLEASSSGLPLLVGEASGSGRFVVEGDTGLTVTGSTPAEWALALEGVLENPARLAAMARAARAWSIENVPTWRQVLREDLVPVWQRAKQGAAPVVSDAIGLKSQRWQQEPEVGT
jgi:putative membrane protein